MRFLMLLGLFIALVACSSLVPATVPIQLEATAGASIIITDEIVDAGLFIVDYPDGWRVVKLSIAGEPIHLVFAAPDESSMWLELSETQMGRPDSTLDPNLYERYDTVDNNGMLVYFLGQSPIERREEFDAIYQQVMESIQFR